MHTDSPNLTTARALALTQEWLDNRAAIKKLEAEQKLAESALLEYFAKSDDKKLGGVTCWARSSTTATLEPTSPRVDRDAALADLGSDATFTAFYGERVMGDEVMRTAAEDKGFRKSLERRQLITRHLDERALATAARENAALADALKTYKLAPAVVTTSKWYLKA